MYDGKNYDSRILVGLLYSVTEHTPLRKDQCKSARAHKLSYKPWVSNTLWQRDTAVNVRWFAGRTSKTSGKWHT